MTVFVETLAPIGGGRAFTIDGNSKITALAGCVEAPEPNALSLPPVATCPGATRACMATCYVRGLAKQAPALHAKYAENLRLLLAVLLEADEGAAAADALGAWVASRIGAGGYFRWHVSGDVINAAHARWIVRVCGASPNVHHWIYTRTLPAVPLLCCAANLAVNVSADADNADAAIPLARANGARVAWLARLDEELPPLEPGDVIFPDYPCRGRDLADPTTAPWWRALEPAQRRLVCPADFFGQSTRDRCGPCARCLLVSHV